MRIQTRMSVFKYIFLLTTVVIEIHGIHNHELLPEFEELFNRPEIKTVGPYFTYVGTHHRKKNTKIKDPHVYCKSFQDCEDCVNAAHYPCRWCHNFGCTSKQDSYCPKAKTKTVFGRNYSCPYIYLPGRRPYGPLLVHFGKIFISVKIRITDPAILKQQLICQITFRDTTRHLKGWVEGDEVHCQSFVEYESLYHNLASLEIIWGGASPFSNEIPIVLYDCEEMGPDCERCQTIPPGYECGWCKRKHKCVRKVKCQTELWIESNSLMCPKRKKGFVFV